MSESKLTFSGEEIFSAPVDVVYRMLTDLSELGQIIPDASQVQQVDEQTLRCKVRPGFGFLRGSLNLEVQLLETEPDRSALMRIEAKGIGQTIIVESGFQVEAASGGARLAWEGRVVDRKGLVATVSESLVRGAAEQVIRQSWAQVRSRLAES